MDPNAAIERIHDLAINGEWDEFASACEDLNEWLSAGGFLPSKKLIAGSFLIDAPWNARVAHTELLYALYERLHRRCF